MSLQVEEGEFISILGPSGCGKTTLLSIIAGLLDPIDGIVFLDGEPITTKTSSMGYMLQRRLLIPVENN